MFFLMPMASVIIVYIAAALLPAVILMKYIYGKDEIEKEPPALLGALLLRGILAALASILLEMLAQKLLDLSPVTPNSALYYILTAFLVVAAVEEGMKFLFLYTKTWNSPDFDYRFDGIVYSAFISLGFAAYENVRYILRYGLTAALPRAVLAVPGHLGFAVVMGFFYGRARMQANRGFPDRARTNLITGYLCAVFLHGFYDSCAMIGSGTSTFLFVVFVVIMYAFIIRLLRKEASTDHMI